MEVVRRVVTAKSRLLQNLFGNLPIYVGVLIKDPLGGPWGIIIEY